jgi:uncharacterized membrane protein YfcA
VEIWQLVVALAGSFLAGYVGSMIGLVLGTLRLPLILLASGDASAAAGTNIAISAAAAASGGVRHSRAGRVDWRVVAWMAPPSVVGALVGGLYGHALPDRLLLAAIAAVLAWNGIDLLTRPFHEAPRAKPRLAPAVLFGAAIGVLGGAIGVILGTLRVPALLRGVGLTAARVVGTNLVVGFFLGAFGFVGHLVQGEVEWAILAAGLAGAIPGGWLGAKATGRFSERGLRRALGIALLAIALLFAVEALAG